MHNKYGDLRLPVNLVARIIGYYYQIILKSIETILFPLIHKKSAPCVRLEKNYILISYYKSY